MSGLQVRCDLVRQCLESVLMDEGFKIGGSKANAAIESANCVLRWAFMPENEESFIPFSDELIKSLDKCLSSGSDWSQNPRKGANECGRLSIDSLDQTNFEDCGKCFCLVQQASHRALFSISTNGHHFQKQDKRSIPN